MRIIISAVVLLLSIGGAHASSCKQLKDAITRFDVNATIADEDVRRWNAVIAASRKVCKRR